MKTTNLGKPSLMMNTGLPSGKSELDPVLVGGLDCEDDCDVSLDVSFSLGFKIERLCHVKGKCRLPRKLKKAVKKILAIMFDLKRKNITFSFG